MANILNNATFLFNPAGSVIAYKEDKANSVLPFNGGSDNSIGGNTGGATRVNQEGYIEYVPANFMLNSATTWTGYNVTVVGPSTGPFNNNDAYRIADINSGNITDYAYKTSNAMPINAGDVITFSIYMKGSGTIATYVERSIAGTYWFNVNAHVLTSEWKLFTHTYTVPYDSSGITVYVGNSSGTTATIVDVALPMVNFGSTAKPYQPTTDRIGYPTIDYKNGKGKLLIEPARTNILTNSQNFNSSPHTLQNASVTLNAGISPDGTNNANKLISSGGSSTFYRWYDNLGAYGGTYTYSIFAKADSGSMQYVCIGVNTNASNGPNNVVEYNIANGTVSRNPYGVTAYVEPYKDGWYRLVHTYNLGTAGSFVHPCIAISDGSATLSTFQNLWNSTSGQYVYLWGSQYESGGFPTSYIPTTSATVTRPSPTNYFPADGGAKTFSAPGIILLDFDFYNFQAGDNYEWFMLSNGQTNGDYWYLAKLGSNDLIYWDGNNSGGYFYAGSFAPRQGKNKLAWYITSTNVSWYVNGTLISTQANFDTNQFTWMQLGNGSGHQFAVNTFASLPTTSSFTSTEVLNWTVVNSGSGGVVSYSGPYTIHTFTGSGTFTPSFNGQVEVLVVAGGGGGGNANDAFWEAGGGGGAGGLLYASSYGVSAGTGITVTVGAGGTGGRGIANPRSGNGSNSVFGGLTAIGGGGGGGAYYAPTSGGSGGGADAYYSQGPLGVPYGNGVAGQGNRGGSGNGIASLAGAGGGGGGAGAVGGTGQSSGNLTGGTGGDGLPYSISGFSTYYAGGGGGKTAGVGSGAGGTGGLGGGGNGGAAGNVNVGDSGVAYTGGGGGGAMATSTYTGNGGSGVVIVRYLT
jgi:hypothetical protein